MKRLIVILFAFLMVMSAVSCNETPAVTTGKQEPENTPAETPAETPNETPAETPRETPAETKDEAKLDSPIDLLGIKVVIPAEADRHVNYAADAFINGVRRMTNSEISLGTAEQEIELLIGNTGRPETETLKATLGEDEFAVKLIGKKLVAVATDDAFLYEAVGVLLDHLRIEDNADAAEGKLTLKRAIDVKQAGDKKSYVYLFSKTDTLTAKGAQYAHFSLPSSEVKAAQGGCFDGKYFYQSYIWHDGGTEANNKAIIVKYDFERKVKIAQSEILSLNHCNDLTYDAELGLLAVANHGPNKKTVTYIDPETLTVSYTKDISIAIYAIDYNYERDLYVTGLSNSHNLRKWTHDLKYDPSIKTIYANEVSKNHTTQGIASDENFIYCVFWDGKNYQTSKFQNIITVYDWYGNYVGVINIDVTKLEPENLFVRNGSIYVTAHSAGAKLFKLKVTSEVE